jgi:hypothetical protein
MSTMTFEPVTGTGTTSSSETQRGHRSHGLRGRRLLAALGLAAAAFATISVPQQAQAAGTVSCEAAHEKRAVTLQPDEHRVRAMCKQLSALTEVHGYVDMTACCDKETSWFRDTYVNHTSAWAQGNYKTVGWSSRGY